ncbi:MAG: efflux RND transporter periplasmic adaptor subunit [Polyangiaceae bacterium]
MRARTRWRLIAGLVIAVGGSAAGGYLALRGPRVAVVRPTHGAVVETIVASGRVLAPAEINVGALVTSRVREVFVEAGATVRAGDLLIQLEDEDARAGVVQAEASLAQAQAGRYEIAKLSEPAARSNLAKAEATLADAQRDLLRQKKLFEEDVGTKAALDEAETALAVAEAQHDAAQLQLTAMGPSGSQTALASASIAFAKAQVERAKALLAHTRVVSPVDGVVLARTVEPGDAIMVGSKLLVISRTGATRLVIEPDERNLARLKVGQKAVASSEAFADQRFDAIVQTIAPSVDPMRGTIEVHLAVPAPPDYLRPHMTVSVEVTVGGKEDSTLVPRKAVRGLATDQPFVLLVKGGKIERRPVVLGIRGDERVEITGGLEEDAVIVNDEVVQLAPGDRVRANASEGG